MRRNTFEGYHLLNTNSSSIFTCDFVTSKPNFNMKSVAILALFGMLAAANAGLLGAPVAPVALAAGPVAYAGAPIVHAAPVAYAVPATLHTRTYHGAPVLYGAAPVVKAAPAVVYG
ncbi:unnamed protein product [Allacma fusca]|uniref:Uncharacterized protein n=1 Tax=Allacma fusca TaxID=39272 RepID=A0A8J2L1F0_9HEXA|nr:unnamed protein product [Allacma fusca]